MPKRLPLPLPAAARKRRAGAIIQKLKRLFPGKPKTILKHSNNWELLVAVILSAQCTDRKVNEVTTPLFKKYKTIDRYCGVDAKKFEQDIYSTGFYKAKTKNILAAAKTVKEKFSGRVPRTMEEMLTIPGVARKSANIILGNAYGVVEGVAVDTHVKRLAYKLGLTDGKTPEKIERDLMAIVPKKNWFALNHLLVEYGRKYCPAKRHNHAQCPLKAFDRSRML